MSFRPAAILSATALAVLLSSCASQPEAGFGKVKIYRLNPDRYDSSADAAIAFEHRHHMYGALTNEDREARRGNYYTFFWSTPDTTTPVTVKFEYRQSTTGFIIHTLQSQATPESGTNTTKFQVTGDDFKRQGKVLSWKATLLQGGKVIGEKKSYMWE